MTLAALPRSKLHLQFLQANEARPDIVFYRDELMASAVEQAYGRRAIRLGRESLPGSSPMSLVRARRHNRAYYDAVAATLRHHEVDKVIIFLEGEPLERFICSLPSITKIELWEDGLSHYVDLTSDLWYGARGVIQAMAGFYPSQIIRRRMDRRQATVRDRFEHANLVLPSPAPSRQVRLEFLLIGSPLVEDRLITQRRFRQGLGRLAQGIELPIRYLAHPREDRARLSDDTVASGVILEPDGRGLFEHACDWSYFGYGAAVSTGLLDLARFDRSVFLPGLFGLDQMETILSRWKYNPLPVTRDLAGLKFRDGWSKPDGSV